MRWMLNFFRRGLTGFINWDSFFSKAVSEGIKDAAREMGHRSKDRSDHMRNQSRENRRQSDPT
jgi:hypothetical protein